MEREQEREMEKEADRERGRETHNLNFKGSEDGHRARNSLQTQHSSLTWTRSRHPSRRINVEPPGSI